MGHKMSLNELTVKKTKINNLRKRSDTGSADAGSVTK